MVNAADLAFVGVAGKLDVQRVRGGEIVAKRLLDHEPLPAASFLVQQRGAMKFLDDLAELARLRGEIKQQVFPQRPAAE